MKVTLNKLSLQWSISIAFFLALTAAFWGCMETTAPEESKDRNIIVQAIQIDTQTGEKTPLSGVRINVFDFGETNPVVTQNTNQNGAAIFKLLAPLAGRNVNVAANYNNQIQTKTSVLICKDTMLLFVFDTTVVKNLQCSNLNGADILIFIDENASRELKQNTPVGIRRYERCWSMTNSSSTESISVAIPNVPSPFSLQSVFLSGVPVFTNPVIVPPQTTLSLCFSVSTANPGVFRENINLSLSCGVNQGTFSLRLEADVVEPGCDCEELEDIYRIILPNSIPVGNSVDHSELVFTNTLSCAVVISRTSFDGNDGWTILSPQFPQTLAPGASLTVQTRFAPKKALINADTLLLSIRPEGTQFDCPYRVIFNGKGCSNTCPYLVYSGYPIKVFNNSMPQDTLSNRDDRRVFVSITEIDPPFVSSINKIYTVYNPDSSCSEITLNITSIPQDKYAANYFRIDPRSITLAPGDSARINVNFTAPSFTIFQQIVAERGNTGRVSDSAFTIRLRLQSAGCVQDINISAVVTTFPSISPIINLRAYSQRTLLKPNPEKEIYYFGNDARTINQGIGGTFGEYPPINGHIYIDVNDTSSSANPPQAPLLKVINNNIQMKLWRPNVPESDFTNVSSIVTQFSNDPAYSTGYSTNPITNINVRDVIAFKFNSLTYALLYIRRVDNGTEATSSQQSGIEFRTIYPIYIP